MLRRTFPVCSLISAVVFLLPLTAPAPLVYTPGEGWTYESVGSEGKWKRSRAEDQLTVAREAFQGREYRTAIKAGRRLVQTWPLSDYAPEAQYIVARSYEARGQDEKAFTQFQKILTQFPKSEQAAEVLRRQYLIADRFLGGQWFKLWGLIPFFPSMDRTAGMFEKIVEHGPFSEVAPHAQLRVGAAREQQSSYPAAVSAYERAADRYPNLPGIAADAIFQAGRVYEKQASKAEYDQSSAGKAIASYTDFLTYYPDDPRAPTARATIEQLATEQARGNFEIAKFYEKRKRWGGALVYYNEVVLKDPGSTYADLARERLDHIRQQIQGTAN